MSYWDELLKQMANKVQNDEDHKKSQYKYDTFIIE